MPELPEVETIRRGLEELVIGRVITGAVLCRHRGFQFSHSRFKKAVKGQRIRKLARRGKYLVFELDSHYCIFHLGMTGQITLRDPTKADVPFDRHPVTGLQRTPQHPVDKHTHLQLALDNENCLFFRDVRKFGKVALLKRHDNALKEFFSHLGLEPFTSAYELGEFMALVKGRKMKVKSLLLDQGVVAGVGNIYADEALFESRIHPSRRVDRLRVDEKHALFDAIPHVLKKGIRFGGTSIRDFINSEGAKGTHQERLNVYGRGGEPCHVCGSELRKIVVSQRGTHFCPDCQPRNGSRKKRR